MAKPIVVMYIPLELSLGKGGRISSANDLMNSLNGWGIYEQIPALSDYIWLCFDKHSITEPELQVFYEKDQQPITNDEIRKLIEDNVNTQKQTIKDNE